MPVPPRRVQRGERLLQPGGVRRAHGHPESHLGGAHSLQGHGHRQVRPCRAAVRGEQQPRASPPLPHADREPCAHSFPGSDMGTEFIVPCGACRQVMREVSVPPPCGDPTGRVCPLPNTTWGCKRGAQLPWPHRTQKRGFSYKSRVPIPLSPPRGCLALNGFLGHQPWGVGVKCRL